MTDAPQPDPLGKFDNGVRRVLMELARTLAKRMLDRRTEPPLQGRAQALHFRRGTVGFARFFMFVDDAETTAHLLALAARGLTQDEPLQWTFSMADPALCAFSPRTHAVIMHPANLDARDLVEVPETVRIFRLNCVQPHDVHEIAPYPRVHIARARETLPLNVLQPQWRRERALRHEQLTAVVRAEFERRKDKLSPDTAAAIQGLLHRAALQGFGSLEALLEAASYLGIFMPLSASFAEPKEE